MDDRRRPPSRSSRLLVAALAVFLVGAFAPAAQAGFRVDTSWRVLVLIYERTSSNGTEARMTAMEKTRAANAAKRFALTDVPALSSGRQKPLLTIRYPSRALSDLGYDSGCWYWPTQQSVARDVEARFDSVIVIWDDTGVTSYGQQRDLHRCGGLAANPGTGRAHATIPIGSVRDGDENVFKHEWGHSILFYYAAKKLSPDPAVDNHIDYANPQYVHCGSGRAYRLDFQRDNDDVENTIYHNTVGFTHDYYSGTTALKTNAGKCLGITAGAWAAGGPMTRPRREYLVNGSFEIDANGNNEPDTWVHNVRLVRSATVMRTGLYSLRHAATDPPDFRLWQTVTGLTAGRTYNLEGYVSIPATSDRFTFKVHVTWLNSAGAAISSTSSTTWSSATAGWSRVLRSVVAPSGTAKARVTMVASSLHARLYLDDFSFYH